MRHTGPTAPNNVRAGHLMLAATTICALGLTTAAGCTGGNTPDNSAPEQPADREPTPNATRPADGASSGGLEVAWAEILTGPTQEDEIDGVAAAPDGTAWMTGKFEVRAAFGDASLDSHGAADAPIARVSAAGETLWVDRFGGPGEDNLFDIDADSAGAVATGWYEGTVDFGEVTLTSAGSRDCVVVSVSDDGSVDWARSFGGPGLDGCNEVTISADGHVVTSIDTLGGWDSPAGPIPQTPDRDTLLVRLDRSGELDWARLVGGEGNQRGKALAVAPDGSIAFGGDTNGDIELEGEVIHRQGLRTDAWLTEWEADGELRWSTGWGGPGEDLAKGVAYGEGGIQVVGPFSGELALGNGDTLDSGTEPDLLVAGFDSSGNLRWATSIAAESRVVGAEVVTSEAGGLLFAVNSTEGGLEVRSTDGVTIEPPDGVTLVEYLPDGVASMAEAIPGTGTAATSLPDEIGRVGQRVYLDVVIRGSANSANAETLTADRKDGSLWALDLLD